MEKLIEVVVSGVIGCVLCLAMFGIRYVCECGKSEPKTETKVIYLTQEEMANRPVLFVEQNEEQAEEVNEEKTKYKVYEEIPLSDELQIYTQELCDEYSVSYSFFLAMCESESDFDLEAVGDSGRSRGAMQINKVNWEKYGLDASMVYDNFEIGIRIMSELIEKYGDFDYVVMAYKGGEGKAAQWTEEGFRLGACDVLEERTSYWQTVIEKE